MSEWQPIETAPKDGTEILIHMALGCISCVYWDDDWDMWVVDDNKLQHPLRGYSTKNNYNVPTHWMPLPDPPKQ